MSNEPTIEQMNEAIAVFDGWVVRPERIINPHQNPFYYLKEGFTFRHICDFDYHSNWSSLMPVVKHIHDTLADMLKKRPPHTACQGDLIEVDIHCAIREVDILKAHGFVYQFCLWHNQQKEASNENNP
jgi:hypothetical protein